MKLEAHLKSSHKTSSRKCKECGKEMFSTKAEFDYHVKQHKPKSVRHVKQQHKHINKWSLSIMVLLLLV